RRHTRFSRDWSSDVCSSALPGLHVVEADALEPMHGALEVPAFFAVELQEGAGVLHDLLVAADLAQVLRDLGLDAAVAADVELVEIGRASCRGRGGGPREGAR